MVLRSARPREQSPKSLTSPEGHSSGGTGALDVLVLGPVPPPSGGIGVHVVRLVASAEQAGFEVRVLNHNPGDRPPFVIASLRRNPFNYLRLPPKIPARVVHYHHSHWSTLLATALSRRRSGAQYLATFHGNDVVRLLQSRVLGFRHAIRWAIRRFDVIIVVNDDIRSVVQRHVTVPLHVLPAYLEEPEHERMLTSSVETFVASQPTLVVAASAMRNLRAGNDLHGLDIAVEAFTRLARRHASLQLALFLSEEPTRRRCEGVPREVVPPSRGNRSTRSRPLRLRRAADARVPIRRRLHTADSRGWRRAERPRGFERRRHGYRKRRRAPSRRHRHVSVGRCGRPVSPGRRGDDRRPLVRDRSCCSSSTGRCEFQTSLLDVYRALIRDANVPERG